MDTAIDFDFDFGGDTREQLLSKASQTAQAFSSELGDEKALGPDAAQTVASQLMEQLNQEVAQFGAQPDVYELREDHFIKGKLDVPVSFKELCQQYNFYWVRFPIILAPLDNMPFYKLDCAVEFNPGIADGHLRPKARMILPERKFQKLLELKDNIELHIGENFEFEAATPEIDLQTPAGPKVKASAGVTAKAAGNLGLIAGPFVYSVKKAQINHSGIGSEKVFWKLDGAEFFQEDEPTLIVVLQVPKEVKQVRIAAALQAYHHFNLWAASLSSVIDYFGKRLANFFRQGAPIRDEQMWDITPNISAKS